MFSFILSVLIGMRDFRKTTRIFRKKSNSKVKVKLQGNKVEGRTFSTIGSPAPTLAQILVFEQVFYHQNNLATKQSYGRNVKSDKHAYAVLCRLCTILFGFVDMQVAMLFIWQSELIIKQFLSTQNIEYNKSIQIRQYKTVT